MKHTQEDHAQNLFQALKSRAAAKISEIKIEIGGSGVHWHCDVAAGNRSCRVHCFDLNDKGAQYYWDFDEAGKHCAVARITSQSDAISAVLDWAEGSSVEELYKKYPFVDGTRRALESMEACLVKNAPALEDIQRKIKPRISDIFYLRLANGERDCSVSFYGDEKSPDFSFRWNECELFKERTDDYAMMGFVLEQWLCKAAAPSAMRRIFPTLKISKIADYYEAGNPIEGEFISSWDSIEQFFSEEKNSIDRVCVSVMDFIHSIRAAGFDRTLRAGQSMWSLVVSRSRRHGMKMGQPCIAFHFDDTGMTVSTQIIEPGERKFPHISLTDEVKELLTRLAKQPIS